MRPVVTIANSGWKGRFANQIFQYAFIKIYAGVHHLHVESPPWIGQHLFGHQDPPISMELPTVEESEHWNISSLFEEEMPRFENVNFEGYFQLHTAKFAPYKIYFRSLFRPTPEVEEIMAQGLAQLRARGNVIIGLHLRRGDYLKYQNRADKPHLFIAPTDWYKTWLSEIWEQLDQPVLFLASDNMNEVLKDFEDFAPVTSGDLGMNYPLASFYPDFYLLSHCEYLAISNSTFSFASSMLNERLIGCVRPHLQFKGLIPYDPWSSHPLLNNDKAYY